MMALSPPRGIITSQKSLPTIKEGGRASVTIYMDLHTRRKLRGSSGRKASTLAPSVGNSLIQSPANMDTPFRSHSSAREEEDNSEWRQAIERRQLASERQVQALL
ncbi:hypothetical protein CK203_026766 [Vitis vinifera]|uniref:Uncharacterized protein n=1 Tax=Vitis vinifera TaxID=29760 RepID=A0A438IP31_VITVI|nr:hypothetical protein CK203_026766 [Vitis vinifera]